LPTCGTCGRRRAKRSRCSVRRRKIECLADKVPRRTVERCVELVGEAARRVSSELQSPHPEIAWRGIIGQRNVLAHEYGAIDHSLLYRTASDNPPALDGRLTADTPDDSGVHLLHDLLEPGRPATLRGVPVQPEANPGRDIAEHTPSAS